MPLAKYSTTKGTTAHIVQSNKLFEIHSAVQLVILL